jgi:hypothetical protein
VTRLRLALPLLALCLSLGCQKQAPDTPRPTAAGPQLSATVLTIRTTVEPEEEPQTHTIVLTTDRARDMRELDRWHLYDLKSNGVTAVDEIAQTTRKYSLDELTAERRVALSARVPSHYPRPRLTVTSEKRPLLGVNTQKYVIESGTYRRELWMGEHPAVPPALFSTMQLVQPVSTPLAPIMREVDESLRKVRGFPLLDRTELTVGEKKIVIERTVLSVTKKNVIESMMTVPRDYRDLTPKPAPKKK